MKKIFLLTIFLATGALLAQEEPAVDDTTLPEQAAPAVEGRPVDADNPGLGWLEEAVEEKLKATGIGDFSKVIALAQRARKEGLSGPTLEFCDELIASERLQRGLIMAQQLAGRPAGKLPHNWNVIRARILGDLEEAVKVVKDQPLPFIRIAQLNLLPEGDTARAKAALDAAERLVKDNPGAFAEITDIRASMEKDPVKREQLIAEAAKKNDDPKLRLLHAASLIEMKQYDKATETLKKILQADPGNAEALMQMLVVLSETGKYEEALKILDLLQGEEPNDALGMQRARLLAGMGRGSEAIKILDELRRNHPQDVSILALRAAVHMDLGNREDALKDIDAALRMSRGFPILLLRAQILMSLERFDEALAILDELRKEQPENDGLALTAIQLLASQKKNRQALDALNPLLEKNPENIGLLRLKGQLLISLNRHTDAVRTLEAVVKADPDDEVSLNNLSWLLSTSPIDLVRNGKRALELAEKACKLSNYKKAYILSTLAAAYAELGDFDKAVEWSQKSLELSAEDDNVKDRVDELRKELETYKKKQPYREEINEP